ncbi:sugar ABC transporter ATP-binding protein [Ammoniphilus resinae]|uniref:ABC-type sugar transport system ATPase subunit n=1 Tax=Ammoniphilus resinae TaxID=861532 RepID=A0ABS4GW20_9BACL|nr:sugar ABC transporter ATP-binding protein [Ammoniphilus resinae]MBP1934468.1 ABC-type sugar transport system ATPase subunit [Ammoniphilus resinae]
MAELSPVLEMKNISKQFFGFYALKNVDFNLYPGEVHSLLGENGAGKSTLIKIMAGVNSLEQGEYLVDGKKVEVKNPRGAQELGVNVVFQELNLVPSLSVAENIFFGRLPKKALGRVNWNKLYQDTEVLLEEVGLEINPRTRVGLLGVAQQQLVEIAKALSHESKVIAMDEPTSALSYKEIERLFLLIEKLKKKGVGIIYVSHKFDELFRITDRITILRDGEKVGEVKTKETDSEELISYMVGRQLSNLYPKMDVTPGDVAFQVKGLTSDKVKDINFYVRKGEIIGFSGLMGAGRTELARAIFGLDQTHEGQIIIEGKEVPRNSAKIAVQRGIGYIPEDRKEEGLVLSASVRENMTISVLKNFVEGGRINKKKEFDCTQGAIEDLRIKTQSSEQKIVSLSGGNQQKVILARWLIKEDLKVLILDEPTRGIDVGSKSEIYRLISELASKGIAVLMMSSEMPELLSMCDRIYVMKEGELAGELSQNEATQEKIMSKAIGGI